jgi:hypothetical protein
MNSTVSSAERLMALGIAVLGWLLCAGLLATLARAPNVGEAIEGRGSQLHLGQFLVPLLAAVLWQSSASALPYGSRLRRAAGLWAAWTSVALGAAVVSHQMSLQGPWSALDLVMQQIGLVLGITFGWLCTPALALSLGNWLRPCEAITRGVVTAVSAAIILVPIAPDASLFDLANGWHIHSFGGYLKALPGQIYLALKSLILWVPVGMLYALAQKQVQIRGWTLAGALAFLIVGLPLLHGALRVQDVLEVLSAYWGIVGGVWLGTQVSRTLPTPRPNEFGPTNLADGQASRAVSSQASRGAGESGLRFRGRAGQAVRRIAAVLLLLGVSAWAWYFPRWGFLIVCGLGLYVLLLWRYRHAWLLVVSAALPLLNLAPGTGRFFFDEFDMLMVTTVAMALWHGVGPLPRPTFSRPMGVALALFGLSIGVSLVIGLLPLSALDANAFTNYLSHYNSVRIAKGFLWALPLLALMRWTLPAESGLVMRLFVPGMWLGLAGVIAVGLLERWQFGSLVDLTVPYRITATFSSMHTGGSEIETYLVTAIPFVWLAFGKEWAVAVRLAGLGLLALGAYLMTLTIARAGVLALGVALGILLLSSWRAALPEAKGTWRATVAAIGFLGGATVLAMGLSGGYLQKRLAHAGDDWVVRVGHWQTALAIRDQDLGATLFGMGLGRFPEAYLLRSGAVSLPGTYGFIDEDGNRFLRLGGGETLYMAQGLPVTEGRRFTLTLRVRSSNANARLGVPLCEKHLLNSFRCQWNVIPVPADGIWHPQSITIDSGLVGAGNWFTRKPVELSLYNETVGTLVDVDDVQLQDEAGERLIHNGDFSAGADYWFFKTHSHLPWHIKNLWVEVLFEQGWFGLISLLLLLAAVVGHLARAVWRGDRLAGVLLASSGGFLTVAVFGSLFDTPRIATLFFLLVVLAGTSVQSAKRPLVIVPPP